MPITLNRSSCKNRIKPRKPEQAAMSAKDRELAELYWQLQNSFTPSRRSGRICFS